VAGGTGAPEAEQVEQWVFVGRKAAGHAQGISLIFVMFRYPYAADHADPAGFFRSRWDFGNRRNSEARGGYHPEGSRAC